MGIQEEIKEIPMKYLLHLNQLGERGTETSTFELGLALKTLGHEVVITYPKYAVNNRTDVQKNFNLEFELKPYSSFKQNDKWVRANIDFAYFLKIDGLDGLEYRGIFNAVHTVFPEYLPHGNSYTYISKWLAEESRRLASKRLRLIRRGYISSVKGCKNATAFDFVPHIVNMPPANSSYRRVIGVPNDAFLIIRYGGFSEFNVPWVKKTLVEELHANKSWYFVGVNTEKFIDHPRAIFLPAITEKQQKSDFLSSANVFLHARTRGESFGMSIVESMQAGIPTLSYQGGVDRNHFELLKETDYLYATPIELREKLLKIESISFKEIKVKELIDIGEIYRPKSLIEKYMQTIFQVT